MAKDYSKLNESTLKYLDKGRYFEQIIFCSVQKILKRSKFQKVQKNNVYYKIEKTDAAIPIVTESIRIDTSLHVQLYFKRCALPLSPWFREGRNCKLISLTQLENFSAYIRTASENLSGSVFEEL